MHVPDSRFQSSIAFIPGDTFLFLNKNNYYILSYIYLVLTLNIPIFYNFSCFFSSTLLFCNCRAGATLINEISNVFNISGPGGAEHYKKLVLTKIRRSTEPRTSWNCPPLLCSEDSWSSPLHLHPHRLLPLCAPPLCQYPSNLGAYWGNRNCKYRSSTYFCNPALVYQIKVRGVMREHKLRSDLLQPMDIEGTSRLLMFDNIFTLE